MSKLESSIRLVDTIQPRQGVDQGGGQTSSNPDDHRLLCNSRLVYVSFVEKNCEAIRDMINRVSLSLSQHCRRWKQLKSRALVSYPALHDAASLLDAPASTSPVPLPCLMESEIKTAKMGTVTVVAVLMYVDVEQPVSIFDNTQTDSAGRASSAPFYYRGDVWYRPQRVGGAVSLHRSLMLHCIQSIESNTVGFTRWEPQFPRRVV